MPEENPEKSAPDAKAAAAAKAAADEEERRLAQDFKEYSVAEFFKKNRQMLGYSGKVRSLTTIVHEYVTNAIDSAEDAKVLPDILVEVHAISAKVQREQIAVGDGVAARFDIPAHIADADVLVVLVDGAELQLKKDYNLKNEKRGRDTVKVVALKSPLAKGSRLEYKWAYGHLRVVVQDNGMGIPRSKAAQAFGQLLSGTKFHQRRQKRGQQGIGASYATLFSQITTGKPIRIKTGIGNYKAYEADVSIDAKTNKPTAANEKEYSQNFRGVRVEAEFSEVTYNRSEYGVYEYLRRTALANPHVQITLLEPSNELIVFPRATKEIPEKPPAVQPHPLGVTTSDLMDMAAASESRKLSSFLQSDFTRISGDKVKELESLVNAGHKPGQQGFVDFNRSPRSLQWPEGERIVQNIQKIRWIAPEMSSVIPVGAVQLEKSLKNLLSPETMKVVERKPRVFRGGIPFVVEAAIAYGGKSGAEGDSEHSRVGEVLRFSNRVPLLFDSGSCAITEAVKTIDWGRYDLKNWDAMPVSILVNFISVHVPYTGAGKLSISQEDEIVTEIRQALMECARDIGIYLHSMQRIEDQEHRRQIFFRYVGEVSQALNELTGKDRKLLETKLRKIAEVRTTIAEKLEEEEAGLEEMEKAAEKEIEEEGK
ncbi:MAG: DNA topoisomerase VI subunit B [Candidatus Micrarchaeota archaeon]